jgi:hypothetical protein
MIADLTAHERPESLPADPVASAGQELGTHPDMRVSQGRPDPRRAWTAGWLGGVVIGVGNGVLREATYGRRLGERAGHDVSGVTAIAAFAAYFRVLQRHRPLRSDREALATGARWALMTVAFEFTFGRLVAKQSWREMLADYDVRAGRTWPAVLAWIAVGPFVARRRAPSG